MNFYTAARACLGGFFRFFYNVKVIGAENEPKDGAFIVCPNHLSNHDVIIVGASFKRQVHYFAKKELFKIPLVKQLVTALGAFPVERGNAASSITSIKTTLNLLEKGEIVGIYPQGTRYVGVDPRETSVKPGIGMIEYHAKVPIVPVLVQTKGWKIIPFKRTYVHIGKPITYQELNYVNGKGNEFADASKYVFSKVTEMIDDDKVNNGN